MKIEQALITQLMVLLNIKNGKNRPSEISKELGITLQGVIYHMKILKEKGDAYGISVKNTGKNECTGVTSVKGIINIKPLTV